MNREVVKQTGPRKPQRTSVSHGNPNSGPINIQGLAPPHRICLETSFTSLQSPTVNVNVANSSITSSITGSIHNSSSTTTKVTTKIQSPNQMNSILSYDFASLLDEQLNMAGTSRTLTPSNVSDRLLNQPLGVYNFTNTSNGVCYRSKQRGYDLARFEPVMSGEARISYGKEKDSCKVDLIHDDWFGLAPLASPESLSELSSISSRTSLNQSNEKCINIITVASVSRDANGSISNSEALLTPEYALHTPKVLRRTPKIPGNLANCADDIKNIVRYQKMNQNFRFLGKRVDGSLSNSSRESSFESATSAESGQLATIRSTLPVVRSPLKYVPSVDKTESPFHHRKSENIQCDDYCLNVKEGFHSIENFIDCKTTSESFVTKSDPNFLESIMTPHTVKCSEHGSNDIENNYSNIKDNITVYEQQPPKSNICNPRDSVSTSSELFLSTKSSMQSYESCETQHASPGNRKGVLMKEKILYGSSFSSEGSPMHGKNRGEGARLLEDSETEKIEFEAEDESSIDKKIVSQKKKCKTITDRNTHSKKNESLPLLSNIGCSLTHSPPASYVKRKKYVYPMNSAINKGESNV